MFNISTFCIEIFLKIFDFQGQINLLSDRWTNSHTDSATDKEPVMQIKIKHIRSRA